MRDSKAHWLKLRHSLDEYNITLGRATAQAYVNDPKMLGFIAARYKFVSKMFAGMDLVLEVGCGDGFGAPIVAQTVGYLCCTDIDDETIMLNQRRNLYGKHIRFRYHDFRTNAAKVPGIGTLEYANMFDCAYMIDVIEHIFPEEEEFFIKNIIDSLRVGGCLLIGTPNITASMHASPNSIEGHVNLKSHESLRALVRKYFYNVFTFSMNDEVVHTGFEPMAHYIWVLGAGRI